MHAWLLDLYDHETDGLVVWVILEDGQRLRLRYHFPVTFYAAGPASRLHELAVWLRTQNPPSKLARVDKRDLFVPHPLSLLAVEVENPALQPRLFQQASQVFPDLTYYDFGRQPGAAFRRADRRLPHRVLPYRIRR